MKKNMRLFSWFSVLSTLLAVAGEAAAGNRIPVAGAPAKVDASVDTIYITGGTLAGHEHSGALESTINSDTTGTGARVNPNRVYALYEGQVYFQQAPIIFKGPTGKLTICGVPSAAGTQKPIILISPVPPDTVVTPDGYSVNIVYGSIKFDNIHYQVMQLTGKIPNEFFMCGTANQLPQSLEINNCLFEFSNIDLFDCTNESGAIGGWPYGAKFRITNSYFRNLFHDAQWWDSRVFQCKHPIDTLWIENCTTTGGGLTFLQQTQLTDFMYINHNTIINNKKYWLLSQYHKSMFITNNIFVNQNWVGEDSNILTSGSDPDKDWHTTINIDTNNATNGLVVQGKYYSSDSSHFVPALDLNRLQIYLSDNINSYDPLLINGYYNSSKYKLAALNALPSYLTWSSTDTPRGIVNVPGQWMNERTRGLFAAFAPPNGGFIEMRTDTTDPGMATPAIADASVVDSMASWNQNLWGDPRFSSLTNLTNTKYIFGDHNPKTLPGIVGGVKSDTITVSGAGITRFTDLMENFSQSTHLSAIDGKPIGSLIWDDAALAGFNSDADFSAVYSRYLAEGGLRLDGVGGQPVPVRFELSQNYPNPFNPVTAISYQLSALSRVTLTVYDILGREVTTLVNEIQQPGRHVTRFDGSRFASGVYFYRLRVRDFTDVKKMILLR